jgi:hypothetical protein
MCAWESVSQFLPLNSATLQFQVLMIMMQMDADFKKEQFGTLFVWVGAWKGGLGGGWSFRGVHPKKYTCLPSIEIKHTPGGEIKIGRKGFFCVNNKLVRIIS